MSGAPEAQGLYDPRFEHDACGIGFVADIQGRRSRRIVEQALSVLTHLSHRAATGAEENTGDGAGILLQIPHSFFARVLKTRRSLPPPGAYGVGMLFLPHDRLARDACEQSFEEAARQQGLRTIAWRTVPTDDRGLGPSARESQPVVRQVFLASDGGLAEDALERALFVARRAAEKAIAASAIEGRDRFYVTSLSCRTIVYKGMLTVPQLTSYFPDLLEADLDSAIAMVHSRFSTNTFPNWARAHPYRYLCHNGEINTLRGNVHWMRARERRFASGALAASLPTILPALDESGSDSAIFDNALELLTLSGRTLPHALMMMVPEPWGAGTNLDAARRSFYEYHALLSEPWDGPAAIAFCDGVRVGAILDRNGLRPARYLVTDDGLVVFSSEAGVLDLPIAAIAQKGQLRPGRMFLVDTGLGRIVPDEDVKASVAAQRPFSEWVRLAVRDVADLPEGAQPTIAAADLLQLQQAFGYTTEDLNILLPPMATTGNEAIGSMGTDTPLAVLSDRAQPLYNYFKQLFAQVTNPPIDAIREDVVVSTQSYLGAEGDLLETEDPCPARLRLKRPLLLDDDLARIRALEDGALRVANLPILFEPARGADGLAAALDRLTRAATAATRNGASILILSDRGVDPDHAPIPALLAVSAVHHHLIRGGDRTRTSLVVETGEAREVHHLSLLIGYGANAVNPYLALATVADGANRGLLPDDDAHHAQERFAKAATKGIVKVMSKMGISTIQSYHGAQIFEALGLGKDVVAQHFSGTPSRIGGVEVPDLAREALQRHARAFPRRSATASILPSGGQYQFRRDGEHHLFNPETVHRLQHACRTNDYRVFQEYAKQVNDQERVLSTLRGLMEFRAGTAVPIDEVETVDSIVRRFKTGAMSYGSISKEAHETLAIAMNRLGGKSNTGEGGEDPARYVPDLNGDSRNSAIKQVASARFGVTSEYLVNAQELQIKMAQGAKPGEGGQLPGSKVYPWIAKVRHATPGVGLISPPPHHDIYSIEDLAQLIFDLKNANRRARVSVKLVAEVGVGTVAAGVAKAKADVILISGHDGGTGASPLTAIKHAGVPWELGLAEAQQVLLLNGLRSRVVLETDGQLKTGRDVVIAALLGAEEFGFATAPLVALGCVMMRACHLNTCPVGVATQDPELRKKFAGDPEHVVNFMRFIAQDVREWMAKLGFRSIDDMVGRSDRLETRKAVDHWKTRGLDYSAILRVVPSAPEERRHSRSQVHAVDATLDERELIPAAGPALEDGRPVFIALPVTNADRTVGTQLGSELTRRYGAAGLPPDTIEVRLTGSAGQSFGAFVPRGITLILEGEANDYVGKGLSGGKLILIPPSGARFDPGDNAVAGNVVLYGATGGEAYMLGTAGERFAVRNSGADAVVEGVGNNGCEYMTGGRVLVLGPTGRNFAAGMSGGIAYVLDENEDFAARCNPEMVTLSHVEDADDVATVRRLLEDHARYTGSRRAQRVLADWGRWQRRFIRVLPTDYGRMLESQRRLATQGVPALEVEMAAFEENARSLARIGGK